MRRLQVGLVALLFVLAACGAPPDSAPSGLGIPPDSAPPEVVLHAYLEAMRAGDCATAHQLVMQTFHVGTGELCGFVVLSAYRSTGVPLPQRPTEIIFGTVLTTGGSSDGSVPAGDFLWSYDLVRQPSGAWRIVNAGQG